METLEDLTAQDRKFYTERITVWRNSFEAFVKDTWPEVELECWQKSGAIYIMDNDFVTIRSGHGVGKTAFLSLVVIWWLCTRFPAKVACTARTAAQLRDVLWAEISKWINNSNPLVQTMLEWNTERIKVKAASEESFAVARTARPENPDALQGFHSDNMLFIIEEASGVHEKIFEVGEGAMSTEGAKTVMVGNPTKNSGYFWRSHNVDKDLWCAMHVSYKDSTRVSPNYPIRMAKKWGETSNVYRVRVLGEFPLQDDDAIVPIDWIYGAINREVLEYSGNIVWGLDVARYGDDRTVLCKRRGNCLREGWKTTWRNKDTVQIATLVYEEWCRTREHERPKWIVIDGIGWGAGVYDILHRRYKIPVVFNNVAESSSAKDVYHRKRDELYFRVRDWFQKMDCDILDDEELVGELNAIKYDLDQNIFKVHSKKKIKEELGFSPDVSDAFMLTFDVPDHMPANIGGHEVGDDWDHADGEDYDPLG